MSIFIEFETVAAELTACKMLKEHAKIIEVTRFYLRLELSKKRGVSDDDFMISTNTFLTALWRLHRFVLTGKRSERFKPALEPITDRQRELNRILAASLPALFMTTYHASPVIITKITKTAAYLINGEKVGIDGVYELHDAIANQIYVQGRNLQ